MRLIPLLLVSVSLLLAGCSKEDDPADGGDGTNTTTTAPTGGATTTTAPTTTTPDGNSTTPTTPTPMELCTATKDFGPAGQPPPAPPATPPTITVAPCGTVTAGYTQAVLNVTWTLATPAPVTLQSSVQVDLIDAAGTAVASCPGPAAGPQAEAPPPCTVNGAVMPGDYQLRFTGNGGVTATISVMVS